MNITVLIDISKQQNDRAANSRSQELPQARGKSAAQALPCR